MKTNAEIAKEIDNIQVTLGNDEGRKPHMHEISSFLTYKKVTVDDKLLTSARLLSDFPKDDLVPTPTNLLTHYKLKVTDLDFDESFTDFSEEKGKSEFNNSAMFIGLNISNTANSQELADQKDDWYMFHTDETIKKKNSKSPKLDSNMVYNFVESHFDDSFDGCYITDIIKDTIHSNSANIKQNFFISTPSRRKKEYMSSNDWKVLSEAEKLEYISSKIGRYNLMHSNITKMAETLFKTDQNKKASKKNNSGHFDSLEEAESQVKKNRAKFIECANIFIQECNIIKPKHLVVYGEDTEWALLRMLDIDAVRQNRKIVDLIENHIEIKHYSGVYSIANAIKEGQRLLHAVNHNQSAIAF